MITLPVFIKSSYLKYIYSKAARQIVWSDKSDHQPLAMITLGLPRAPSLPATWLEVLRGTTSLNLLGAPGCEQATVDGRNGVSREYP